MRNRILDIAREHIGVRFRHQGRTVRGIDCVGLLVLVARRLEIPHYDESNYQRRTNGLHFIGKFRQAGFRMKSLSDRLPGDIVVIEELGQACHVAILSNKTHGETMIHAYASRRMVVEEPYTIEWQKRTVGCYAFPGVG